MLQQQLIGELFLLPAYPQLTLILGTPASGKSSVAKALMQRFERGVHLPVDDIRHFVVSGLSDLSTQITQGTWRQVAIARAATTQMAEVYAKQDFAVAIDDFWNGDTPDADYYFSLPVQRIVLFPKLETTIDLLRKSKLEIEISVIQASNQV